MPRPFFYLLLALQLNHNLFSQTAGARILNETIVFHRITTEQGLPNDIINCVVQDKKGFLWIGTTYGLCRYDGSRMITYRYNSKDSLSISDNNILSIATNSSDKLFLATFLGGLNVLDINTNIFTNYRNQKNNDLFTRKSLYTVVAVDSTHLATANSSLSLVDLKNKTVELITSPRNTWSEKIASKIADVFSPYRIFIDHEKKWWLSGEAGVVVYDPAAKKMNLFSLRPDVTMGFKNHSSSFCHEDKEGNVWIGSGDGLFEYNRATDKVIKHYPTLFAPADCRSKWVKSVLCKSDGSIWFGTDNGLYHYYPGSGKYSVYHNNPNEFSSISNNNINCLYEDKQNIVWVGTENGLNAIYPQSSAFNVYQNIPGNKNSLQSNITKASLKDENGNIWVGTAAGLECIETRTGKTYHYQIQNTQQEKGSEYFVMPIIQNDKTSLWVGTWGVGLHLFDIKKRKYISSYTHTTDTGSICSNFIHSLCKDGNGNIWIATWNGGIDKLNPRKKNFEHFNTANKRLNSDYINRIYFFEKTIWASYGYGLLRFDSSSDNFIFLKVTDDSTNINATAVSDLSPDEKGNLLLSTLSGLIKFGIKTNKYEKIDLPGVEAILAIQMENSDKIWLATNAGLKLYIPSANDIISYTLKDGLPISYFSSESYFHLSNDGEIFLSSNNGLIHFYPNKIIQNSLSPTVTITSVKVNDEELSGDFDKLKELHLTYKQNYLTIGFAALNFINPTQNQYLYKLEDVDKGWIYAGNRNEVIYPNLPPGNYVFKLKGSNDAGIWNEKEILLNIHIDTPWWKTGWFYTACFIIIGLGIYSLYRVRVNRILAEQKLRNKIARDLHDDIGSTLSGIKLFSSMAQNKLVQEGSEVVKIVERITERSEKMIDSMSDIVWSINPVNDLIENMLVRMKQYAAEMFEPRNISYQFDVEENISKMKIPLEVRKDIYLVFKESINNAVKHSNCRKVKIILDIHHRIFKMKIIDDGIGFDINVCKRKGNGLGNFKVRAKNIGGKIDISSSPGMGTNIELTVPVT